MTTRRVKTICYMLPVQIMAQSRWCGRDKNIAIIGQYNKAVYAIDTTTCELIIRNISQSVRVYQYTLFYVLVSAKQTKPIEWLSEPKTITMHCNIDGISTNQHTIVVGLSTIELARLNRLKSKTNVLQVVQTIKQNLNVDIVTEYGFVIPIVFSIVKDVPTFRLEQ